MTRVSLRPEAEADLVAIALYVGKDSVRRAKDLVARLRARCRILEDHPHAGRPRDEIAEGLRSLVERPYVIFYKLAGAERVEIVAFLHSARDFPSSLSARLMREEE